MSLFWIPVVVVASLLLAAGFFFVLYLTTSEPVPLRRARALWRWVVVIGLGSFDIWIFGQVFAMLRFIFF
ncbi:MAG: hypothetical protein RLY78_576 [Pseudomonadota bacterium]|jgi:hypothetical protein|uniref:Uncharacterized protein n=1 Tax=Pseudaquabacterium rugosum TaxID=2984194 RepID=A0ABU9B7E1_9BURK